MLTKALATLLTKSPEPSSTQETCLGDGGPEIPETDIEDGLGFRELRQCISAWGRSVDKGKAKIPYLEDQGT